MTRARVESGFTLVEVLLAMLLSGVIFMATMSALDAFQRANATDILRNEASDNARTAVDRLARQLRNAAAPSIGYIGALEEAEPYSISFQTIDPLSPPKGSKNETNAMRVRYCLDSSKPSNEVVWLQQQRWTSPTPSPEHAPSATACPDLAGGDWETSYRLASHVTNRNAGQERPLFTYGPSSSVLSQITTVETHVYLDVRPGQTPGETQQATTIELRNANRQPVAAFTATEVNGHVVLDASSSEDPDGLALTYRWFENGKELTTTSQKYQTEEFKTGSLHTYKLEVKDPGGLTSSVEHEVKIK